MVVNAIVTYKFISLGNLTVNVAIKSLNVLEQQIIAYAGHSSSLSD